MSGTEYTGDKLADDILAFEFVSGTLQGSERLIFKQRLGTEAPLMSMVVQWEEKLMVLQNTDDELLPLASTWKKIEQATRHREADSDMSNTVISNKLSNWLGNIGWLFVGALASFFVVTLIMPDGAIKQDSLQVDYIAVLTSDNDTQALTTTGNSLTKTIQLNWSEVRPAHNEDYQLWAVSKRDGEIRSLAIIDDTKTSEIKLSNALWRLVTDAETLILTVEEEGGSAIDEPSNRLVARGICVRVRPRRVNS